jgi:Flp pilus assembly pilin Flp
MSLERRAYCDAEHLFDGVRKMRIASRLVLGRGTQAGQGLAEYALILALIAVASIIAVKFMGRSINGMLSELGNRK